MRALLLGCVVWLGCSGPTLRVDQLEDDLAQVVELPSGRALLVRRSSLPAGVQEGDLLVEGEIDHVATAQARAEVRQARARAFPRKRTPPLTLPKEE